MSDHEPLLNTKLEKAFHQFMDKCPVNFSVQHTSTSDAYTVTFFLNSPIKEDHA